jgi:hypothetical protein
LLRMDDGWILAPIRIKGLFCSYRIKKLYFGNNNLWLLSSKEGPKRKEEWETSESPITAHRGNLEYISWSPAHPSLLRPGKEYICVFLSWGCFSIYRAAGLCVSGWLG